MVRVMITFISPITMLALWSKKTLHVKKTGVRLNGFSLKPDFGKVNLVISQDYQSRVHYGQTG